MSSFDEDSDGNQDTAPQRKLQLDNKTALARIRQSIQLDPSLPWTESLSISYPETISVDVDNDLDRELAFYKQALASATTARSLASSHNLPFTRPPDFFAEMVKSDSHMERIRQRLLDDSAGLKRAEDKRKEREGKKFGKQVQLDKIRERERSKKDMQDKLKDLKRKRKDAANNNTGDDDDGFDVAVEDAISDRPSKRGKNSKTPTGSSRPTNNKPTRQPRGKGKKTGTVAKTGPKKRLGKSRRLVARSKR